MDALTNEFGVDVFNPWAEQDLEDAVLAADSQVSRDGIFNRGRMKRTATLPVTMHPSCERVR